MLHKRISKSTLENKHNVYTASIYQQDNGLVYVDFTSMTSVLPPLYNITLEQAKMAIADWFSLIN